MANKLIIFRVDAINNARLIEKEYLKMLYKDKVKSTDLEAIIKKGNRRRIKNQPKVKKYHNRFQYMMEMNQKKEEKEEEEEKNLETKE